MKLEINSQQSKTNPNLISRKKIFFALSIIIISVIIFGYFEFKNLEKQTYINETFNLEFEYPNDWYYNDHSSGDNQFLICLNPKGISGDCVGLITISWNVDFEERYNGIKKVFEKYEVTESETTISNVPAKMFTVSGYESGREGSTRELFFEHDGFVYNIGIGYGNERVFDQIVKSFEILKD